MPRIPNLLEGNHRFLSDMDDTLAPSAAALGLLYAKAGEEYGLNPKALLQERQMQRRMSRQAAKDRGTNIVAPYDVYEHLGLHSVSEQEIDDMVNTILESGPNLLYPGARRLLGALATADITPGIVSYGHEPTQRSVKARLNGLDKYPLTIVDTTKGVYLSTHGPEEPFVLLDDRPKHLADLPAHGLGVLYDPHNQHPEYDGLVIRDHEELLG